jgi:hypothetical protein
LAGGRRPGNHQTPRLDALPEEILLDVDFDPSVQSFHLAPSAGQSLFTGAPN